MYDEMKILRLMFMPEKYFDSFTISSILNNFEKQYLKKYIDVNVNKNFNNICFDELFKYNTTINEDKIMLNKIKY